jgi:hypothetical protein
MSKTAYSCYTGPAYDLNLSNKTALTAGVSHEVSASLSNATKLSVGTEIRAGLSTSLKFGHDIEFKLWGATKAEIDIKKEKINETSFGTTNIYNANNFRVTAGELATAPVNRIKAEFIESGNWRAFFALLLQLAATSLTISTALKANLDASDAEPDVPFWGGAGGSGAKYWASWSTVLIEGFSLVSLVLAFFAGRAIDNSKRESPLGHQNFLNMDKNSGIMLGVQSDLAPPLGSKGSWYLQNNESVEIGCSHKVKFNQALDIKTVSSNDAFGRLTIKHDGVKLEGGQTGIENLVYKGAFKVKIAGVAAPRIELDGTHSFVRRPDPSGANYGLVMQSDRVKLSLNADTDLDLSAGEVKLRTGTNTGLTLASAEAKLIAETITLAATKGVEINGVTFKPGVANIGDLQAVITNMSALATQAKQAADNTKATMESMADDVKTKTQALNADLAEKLDVIRSEFNKETASLKSTIKDLTDQIARLSGA